MKPRLVTAILLFISAYSPLFVILAIKDFDFDKTLKFHHPTIVFVMLSLTALSIVALFITIHCMPRGSMPVRITSVQNRSADLINYTIPYILSFFGFNLSKLGDVISLSIFLLIMMLLTIRSKSVFLNPILALYGYGLYDINYKYNNKESSVIVLSKEDLTLDGVYYIRSITRFLYFVKERKVRNE